jgi:hypothetical protein
MSLSKSKSSNKQRSGDLGEDIFPDRSRSSSSAAAAAAAVRLADSPSASDDDASLLSEDLSNRSHAHLFDRDDQKAGNWATFFNLITSYLGSGILALPFAYKKSGIIVGVVSTFIIALLSNHCIRLLLSCKYTLVRLCAETRPNGAVTIDYAEIAKSVDGR